jgi:mannosyltransferase OCH1-like enzyme
MVEEFPIPKIIHLTYKSKKEILPEWKDVIPSWKKTNPTWEIKFWSDKDNEELVKNEFPWFYETYKNFRYNIQRADAVRCCYLYKYGGLYIDMDYLPVNKIDKLFYSEKNKNNNQIYLTTSVNIPIFTNSFMASKQNCNFWIEFLKSIMNTKIKWYWTKHLEVMYTTGPNKLNNFTKTTNIIIGIINPHLIQSCDVCEINKNINSDKCISIYLKKIKGGSWNSIDSLILNWILCNRYKSLLILIFILYLIFYFSSKSYICKYSCSLKNNKNK